MNVDSLEFEVLINDADFTNKVKDLEKRAQDLNTQLSKLLQIQASSHISTADDVKNAERMNALLKERRDLESKLNNQRRRRVGYEQEITKELEKQSKIPGTPQNITINNDNSKTINNMRESQAGFNKEVLRSSRLWYELKNITTAYFSIMGAERLVSNMIRVSAEFEKQRVSLEAILHDVNGADRIFEQIKSLAVVSPFTFKELVTYTKQLSAFSVPMEELYDTTKMLADVSAGLGVGMDRLILAYGQIRSASFLRGQEVRQLTEAGVPILQELSKMLTEIEGKYVSVGEVFDKISARQVTFEMVSKVFQDMTSEGGKFYQMQEVLAETLSGKLSNLTDAYQIMFAEIGEKTNGVLISSVNAIRSLAENYEKVGKTILELVSIYGAYKATIFVVQAIEASMLKMSLAKMAGETIGKVTALNLGMESLVKTTTTYRKVASLIGKLNPYGVVIAGVTALGIALAKTLKQTTAMERSISSLHKDWATEEAKTIAEFDNLYGKMKAAKKGTEEYATARRSLYSKYDSEIAKLREEGVVLSDNAASWKRVKDTIVDAARERFRFTATEDIEKEFKNSINEVYSGSVYSLEQLAKNLDLSIGEKNVLWGYITGNITDDDLKEMDEYAELLEKINNGYVSLGAGSSGPMKARDYIDILARGVKNANDEYAAAISTIDRFWRTATKGGNNGATEGLEGWRKKLADIVDEADKAGVSLGLIIDENSSLSNVVKDIADRTKEASEAYELNLGNDEKVAAVEKRRLEYYKKMNEAIGGKVDMGGNTSVQTVNPRIAQINEEIEAYKTLQGVYEDFLGIMDAAKAKTNVQTLFSSIYGDKTNANYMQEIMRLVEELRALDPAAAEKALSSLGIDNANAIMKSYNALQKYNEEVTRLLAKDYGLEGTGLEFKISKILTGLTTENTSSQVSMDKLKKQVDEQELYIKSATKGTEIEKESAWAAYKKKAYEVIEDIYKKEKEYNKKSAQEKITQLAQSAIQDNYATLFGAGSKALSDWGDKTLGQIRDIITKLTEAQNSADSMISPELISKANKLGISFDDLLEAIKQIIGADIDNALIEKIKKAKTIATETKSILSSASSIIRDLGENIDNQVLIGISDALDMIDEIADIILSSEDVVVDITDTTSEMADDASNIANSFSVMTMVIKILLIFVQGIVDIWAGAAEAEAEAVERAREFKKAMLEVNATSQDGIFGENQWRNILVRMEEYQKSFKQLVNEVEMVYKDGIFGRFLTSGLSDDNGVFSLEKTMAMYEAGLLTDETADIIENVKTLQDAIADIFGQISDDIVENMVTAFEETGDAVSNLEDAFADMGETLVKSILKSYILEVVLNKYKDRIYSLIDEYNDADNKQSAILSIVEKVGEVFSQMSNEIEGLGPFINALLEKAQTIFGSFGGSESNNLSSGITSITEDTANLLASYINAIRADVSSTRLLVESVSTDVKAILGLLPSTPTLAEYLTKIEANTFNNAEYTRSLMENIASVTTSEPGATSIRVYSM